MSIYIIQPLSFRPYICLHFSANSQHQDGAGSCNPSWWKGKNPCALQSQYHGSWYSGSLYLQVISSHNTSSNDMILPEYLWYFIIRSATFSHKNSTSNCPLYYIPFNCPLNYILWKKLTQTSHKITSRTIFLETEYPNLQRIYDFCCMGPY